MRAPVLLFVLPIMAGVLYAAAFVHPNLWPAGFVTLWPIFFGLERLSLSAWKSIALGTLFGFTAYALSCFWLVGTLVRFFGFHAATSVATVALFSMAQGGQLALLVVLLGYLGRRGTPVAWAAVPVVAALELVYPLVFPAHFGNMLHPLTTVVQVADLGGPILVTVLLMLASAAGYELVAHRYRRRSYRALCVLAALTWAAALLYGEYRINDLDARVAVAEQLDVAVVQANLGADDKGSDPGRAHRAHVERSLELETEAKPGLIVWPETVAGLVTSPRRKQGGVATPLLFGGIEVVQEDNRKELFNSAFIVGRTFEGKSYRKQYLLPFGEYLPFGDAFPGLYEAAPNTTRFTAGSSTEPLMLGSRRISVMICYEDILPRFVRAMVRDASPELLVNLTDDAWFGDTPEPWMHLGLSKFRAVEHHRYLVRATTTGVSAIIDPAGRVVASAGVFEPAVVRAPVRWLSGETFYARFGDWPGWIGLLSTLALVIRARRASSPMPDASESRTSA